MGNSANTEFRQEKSLPAPPSPEIGDGGQMKLLDSKVLQQWRRGLGSQPACIKRCGVGTLGIVDMDVVDESNLQTDTPIKIGWES